ALDEFEAERGRRPETLSTSEVKTVLDDVGTEAEIRDIFAEDPEIEKGFGGYELAEDPAPAPASEPEDAAEPAEPKPETVPESAPEPETETDPATDDVDEHYDRIKPVLETLGESDGAHSLGVYDHHGWYKKQKETDVDLIDEGYDERARPFDLVVDTDEFSSRIDRHYYSVLNYQDPEVLRGAEPCRTTDEGTEFRDGSPLPNYEDIEAFSLFVDIDLKDEHKERPLTSEKKEKFERVISDFVDAFGCLVGDKSQVFTLDSVGGAYVFVRPQVTAPIAEEFDGEERGKVFSELAEKARDWVGETAKEIIKGTPAEELCKADKLVNVNRQYKAPLSLHKGIDGVVHPLETEGISYDFVPLESVDDTLIDETAEWAEGFTAPVATEDPLEELVEELFGEYDGETWEGRLSAYLEAKEEEERRREERAKRAAEKRAERREEGVDFEGAEVTPFFDDVQNAVEDIGIREVVRKYASDAWDTSSRSGETTFDPSWRASASGKSCAVPDAANNFIDNDGGGGRVAKAYGLGQGIVRNADADLSGEDWWRAVDGLREEGYDIPVYVPEKDTPKPDGTKYERTPLWAVRKGAVALGVVDEDDFIEREGDDGGTYLDFPDQESRKGALEALEDEGIKHGWDISNVPTFDMGGGYTLRITPVSGRQARLSVLKQGSKVYSETLDKGAWESRQTRLKVASAAADVAPKPDTPEVKEGVKKAFQDALAKKEDDPDRWAELMRDETTQGLIERTEDVVVYPDEEGAVWVVSMEPPEDSPEHTTQTFEFEAAGLNNQSPTPFLNEYLSQFLVTTEVDSEAWMELTEFWIDVADPKDPEVNVEKETFIESILDDLNSGRFHAVDWNDRFDAFDWNSNYAIYSPSGGGLDDVNDEAVLVPGSYIQDKIEEAGIEFNVSKELRERDILLCTSKKVRASPDRHSRHVWVFNAQKTLYEGGEPLYSPDDEPGEDEGVGV
ncbi:MAG: hypothetical protein SV253_07815, partial [Halobacteria archaeon]|nr:hypothetical protein [Halobacteria archaeon]